MSMSPALPQTYAVLESRGIQVEEEWLDEVLATAFSRLTPVGTVPEPRVALSSGEIAALAAGGFPLELRDLPAGRDPLKQTAQEYAAILATGLATQDAATRLKVDPSRIRQRLTTSPPSLYGVRLGDSWCLPAFQFTDQGLVPGIDKVIEALPPNTHPVAFYRWLTLPHSDLRLADDEDRAITPFEWLLAGYPASEVAALVQEI